MYKVQNNLVELLFNSINRLNINIDKNIIYSSLQYDIYQTAFKSNIALKLQINASDILDNLNLNNGKCLFKEITIKDNYIYFFLNNITKYQIFDNIFNNVIMQTFGKGFNKNLIIDIQYQYNKDDNSLSYYREYAYYQALINLYKIRGYTVQITNDKLILSDYAKAFNIIKEYVHESYNSSWFQGNMLICDRQFTKYVQYICNYVKRYLGNHKKNITICSKPYNIEHLQNVDKLLRFKYSNLFETEPIIINLINKKYMSNEIKYKNFDYLNNFKYSCMEHAVNRTYIFNINESKLKFILDIYYQIEKLINAINNLDAINNCWYMNNAWRIFKNDEILLNHISQLNNTLNFATKEIRLNILTSYLFKLCHLAKLTIYSTSFILKNYNEVHNIDSKQLKSKLKLLIITNYTIKFILDIFEIRV